MDDSSDRDPMRRESSRFEDAERAVRSVDEPPSGSPPGTPAANADESPLRTVGAAVALGVGGILILIVITVAVGVVGTAVGFEFSTTLIASIVIGQGIAFFGLGTAYLRSRGLDLQGMRSYLGVRLPTLREVGVVVVGYIVLLVAILVGVSIITVLNLPEPAGNEGGENIVNNGLFLVGIAVMFLVVGPAEEFLFRGIVQNRLRERFSAVPAVAIAGVIFASVHLISVANAPAAAAATTIVLLVPAGIVLGTVYECTGNIVLPWLLHSTHNSVLLTLALYARTVEGSGLLSALV